MGVVIRPAAFARAVDPRPILTIPSRRRPRRLMQVNRRLIAVAVAVFALAWILTLAGAAFAVRLALLMCFATLAGRARRVGVPVYAPIRLNRRK